MRAMIFAAGFGKRLGALSASLPKPLVDVNGKAIIELVVENLKRAGVDELVINLHYLSDKIKEYFKTKANFGLKVTFLYEPEILGTGGGLKNAEKQLIDGGPFIVHNADVYCDADLSKLVTAHKNSQALATLAVMERKSSRYLVFDENDCLAGWENPEENLSNILNPDNSGQRLAFSGIQVLSPELFEFLRPETGQFSIIRAYMNAAKAGKKIMAHRIDNNHWVDIGTPQTLEALRVKLSAD